VFQAPRAPASTFFWCPQGHRVLVDEKRLPLLRVDRVNSSPFTSLIDYLLASQPVISARSAPSAQNPAPPVSIFSVAAALAKVQAQLANPEKSLVGTIQSDAAGAVGHHGMEIGLVTGRANLSGRPMMCRKSPTQIWRAVIDGE
jgi:hypothetical protein